MNLPIKIIFVVGAPGAGKGTLCSKHPVEYGYKHISVGDYLRELCDKQANMTAEQRGGLLPHEIKDTIQQTQLLPAEPLMHILLFKLRQEYEKGRAKFIIDGFPRTIGSARLFGEKVCQPEMVLHFVCSKETARSRFLARRREDTDSETKFSDRYAQYMEENAEILKWYGPVVKEVDTEGGVEKSHEVVRRLFEALASGASSGAKGESVP